MNRATPSRTVRVFLSSTFRDFAEERDLLVRKVFPELRRKCRERQVELVDVDLRWGITEKEAQQGRVLPICLAEVDRSRPWFMGFIGERYGWVPAPEQFDPAIVQEQPWLEEHRGGKSVTELEILHGVLNNPKMAGRAFFYFRDSKWSKKQGGSYLSEGREQKAKLEGLKERIRQSGFPVLENYPSPEALAERIKEDLWKLIDEAYPESEVPDALTRERMAHEAYAATRCRLYLGGERYFAELDDAMKAKSFRPVLITGQSGGGKSALLANWVKRWSPKHSKTAVIMHHLGSGSDAADPVSLVVRLMREISRLTGDEFKPESDPEKQLEQLPQWLALASAWAQRSKKELLIMLDGLDKVSDRKHLRWFPGFLPPKVKLVAACLHGEILEAAKVRLEWQELKVKPFTKVEQKSFISEYLGRYRKALMAKQMKTLQGHPLSGNPLFLLTVLEELRVFGVHEELEQRMITLLSLPPSKGQSEVPTVDDVFEHVLARIEQDLGKKAVQLAMEAIWASRAGLYQDELLAIAKLSPAKWAAMQNALDESIYESSGKITFGHDYLRKAVEDRYGLKGKRKLRLHRRLADWFAQREVDERVAAELPWQWRQAGEKEALTHCLLGREIFEKCYTKDEYELLSYWLWTSKHIGEEYEQAWKRWKQQYPNDVAIVDRDSVALAAFLEFAGIHDSFVEHLLDWSIRGTFESSLGPTEYKVYLLLEKAEMARKKGDYNQASAWIRTAMGNSEFMFETESHPELIKITLHLIPILYAQGKYNEAASLCIEAIDALSKKTNGEDCLTAHMYYGIVLDGMKSYELAEKNYHIALAGYEKTLGPNHPSTLTCRMNLANLFSQTGRFKRAENLHVSVLKERENLFGEHPDTNSSRVNLAVNLIRMGKQREAEALLRSVLSSARTLRTEDREDYWIKRAEKLCINDGNLETAENVSKNLVVRQKQNLRLQNPCVVEAVMLLDEILCGQNRSKEGGGFCEPTLGWILIYYIILPATNASPATPRKPNASSPSI